MKKIIFTLLAACLWIGIAAGAADVYEVKADDVVWEDPDDGICESENFTYITDEYEEYVKILGYTLKDAAEVEIPASIKGMEVLEVNGGAFRSCSDLTEIKVDANNNHLASENGILYNKEKTRLISCPLAKTGSVKLPDTLTSIYCTPGYYSYSAFSDTSLNEIIFPASLTKIGEKIFQNCKNLKSITFAEGLVSIENRAFYGCSGLDSVIFPDSLVSIGMEAFEGCSSLNDITFSDGLRSIQGGAFNHCSSLNSIIFPNGLETIAGYAFNDCSSLSSVIFPETLKEIGGMAFFGTNLSSVVIPAGVEEINYSPFANCMQLTDISVDGNTNFIVENGILYDKGKTRLICCLTGKQGDLELPSTLEKIGDYAFYGCSGIKRNVKFPETLLEIGGYAFYGCSGIKALYLPAGVTNIGYNAFHQCYLEDVYYAGNEEEWDELAAHIRDDEDTSTLISAETHFHSDGNIPEHNLEDDYSYEELEDGTVEIREFLRKDARGVIEVPSELGGKRVTRLGDDVFDACENITEVLLPEGLLSIGRQAFVSCESLTHILLPKSLRDIDERVFCYCYNLKEINVADGNQAYVSENGVLYNKEKTKVISYPGGRKDSLALPDSITEIVDYTFEATKLTGITLPEGLLSIGESAFRRCENLTEITLPSSLENIGLEAFHECDGLAEITVREGNQNYVSEQGVLFNKEKTSLILCPAKKEGFFTVPEGVKYIYSYAFSGCENLTGVKLPENTGNIDDEEDGGLSIGTGAFERCKGLTEITLSTGVTLWNNVFSGCWNLKEIRLPDDILRIPNGCFNACGMVRITLPDSIYSLGSYAFSFCDSLKEITIPKNVKRIDSYTFWRCDSLEKITIPEAVTYIDPDAFADCSGLKDVYFGGSEQKWNQIGYSFGPEVTIHYGTSSLVPPPTPPIPQPPSNNGGGQQTGTENNQQGEQNNSQPVKTAAAPKKVTLSSVKSNKKKTATVKWKKVSKASGYIIQFSTDKKFKKDLRKVTVGKSKTVSKTVGKLKAGKKYYVRVCAYVKSGGKKIQGNWSKVKSVKVKK